MKEKPEQLTSVKVYVELFEQVKIEFIKRKFSLNKLVNRAIFLYLTNEDFRRQITNQNNVDLENKQ